MRASPSDGLAVEAALAAGLRRLEISRNVSRDAGGRAWGRPFDPGGLSERSVRSCRFLGSRRRRARGGGPREAARLSGEPRHGSAVAAYACPAHFLDEAGLQISAARRCAAG